MKRLKKSSKIFLNYIVGPILFVWLCSSIYRQVTQHPDLPQAFDSIRQSLTGQFSWKLFFVLFLMFWNWGLEAKKWQLLVRNIQQVSLLRSFRAIFTGQALALTTFNGIGESAGRIVYLEDGKRLQALSVSIAGSLSQVIITMVMGVASMVYVRINLLDATHSLQGLSLFWFDALIYILLFGTFVLLLVYFKLSWLTITIEKIPIVSKYSFYLEKLEDFHWKELTTILLLSFIRYVVFVVQYLLLLELFKVDAGTWALIWLICLLFLALAIAPTIALAELGIRGKLSLLLFGLVSTNVTGILATAAGIWFINRVIPALAGSLFILGIRLFKK